MGKKVTYERWINIFLPDAWTEREEMGFVLLEREGWPGMVQLSFIERDETKTPPAEAARVLLEDTLEDRDVPFPREAVKVEERGDMGIAALDYTYDIQDVTSHWRIWFLVDNKRAVMIAYVSDPEHISPSLDETTSIIADIEFVPCTND
jgi:hypothetical protein